MLECGDGRRETETPRRAGGGTYTPVPGRDIGTRYIKRTYTASSTQPTIAIPPRDTETPLAREYLAVSPPHCVHTLTAEPALARFKVRCGDRVAGITETAQMRRGRAIACNMHHAQAEESRLSLPFLSSFAARVASARRRGTAQRARRSTTSPAGSRKRRRAV